MVRPQLLRKAWHAAAAARDGLHQVGTGLQQELGWQDFNLPPGLGNQSSNNTSGPRGPFSHGSNTGCQWSPLNHSSLPYGGITPLALGTQILPALHSHHQHQYSHPHRKPHPLAHPPPRPPAPFQKVLPLPLAPKAAGSSRGAPLTAPLVATPTHPWDPHHPSAGAAAPASSTSSSTVATAQQDSACPPHEGLRHALESGPQLQGPVGAAGQAPRAGEVEGATAKDAASAALPAGSHAHGYRPVGTQGLDSFVSNQAPIGGGPGKGSYAGEGPFHGLTVQHGMAGKLPSQEASGRLEASLPPALPPHQQRAHHPTASMHQSLHPARKRARGSGVSVALNKSIMSASCVGELLALVRARGHNFDFFNISSAVSRAPKLVEAEHASAKSNARAAPLHTSAAAASASPLPSIYNNTAAAVGAQIAAQNGQSAATPGCPANTPPPPPMGEAAKALAAHLYALSLQHLHTFDARGLANTAWAFAKMRYVPDSVLPAALSIEASTRIDEFAAQNLSNLAWAMVYMHWRDPHLLGLMANRVLQLLDQFKPQELANIMWAFASLEHHDHTTLSALSARAAQLGPCAFKEQEISNIIWALGRAYHHEGPLLDMLLQETLNKLSSFQPQGVSNIVWALGQLNHASPSLLSAIGQRCSRAGALSAFDNQGLCNLAFGTAVLRFRHPSLMAALADEALLRVAATSSAMPKPHLATQQVHQHPGSHDNGIGGREHGHLPSCLTTVLWAATTLQDWGAASKLLTAVANEVNMNHPASTPSNITHSWEPTSLAQAAWSCARMRAMMAGLGMTQGAGPSTQSLGRPELEQQHQQQHQQLLLSNLAEAVAARVDRFNGQPLALVMSAFCTPEAGHDACGSKLVDKLARRVERATATLSEQQCEVCVEALQQVQHCPSAPAALEAIHKRAAALASVHSSNSSICSSSNSSSSSSMHAAYGSTPTAVSSPGSNSSSSSNSAYVCSSRIPHPKPRVQQGMGLDVHTLAQQLLQQQQQQQQGRERGQLNSEGMPNGVLGGLAGLGGLPDASAILAANAAHMANSADAAHAAQAAHAGSEGGDMNALAAAAAMQGQLNSAKTAAAGEPWADMASSVDIAHAAQAAYAGSKGGAMAAAAAMQGQLNSAKAAAAGEPWASAWPEGLFQDNPASLLAEAEGGSCLGPQATLGGMWSEGGLGNGSIPSITASPSLTATGVSSSSAAPSLANVTAPFAAADAGVASGGLGQLAADELQYSELAALAKMMAEGDARKEGSCESQSGDVGLGAASAAAPLGGSIFWNDLGSLWCSTDMHKTALADPVAPVSFPGLAAAPSAACYAGVGNDQNHSNSSNSVLDPAFQGTPVPTSEENELKHAHPLYGSELRVSSPMYSSVPHMGSSVPHTSAGVVDSGAGAEVDSIGLLPKGLFDLIDEGHHCQSMGDARNDWAMFAPL